MVSKVYFIKASLGEGEVVISQKGRKLFKAAGFSACFRENDFTAFKVHVGEAPNNTYIKSLCFKDLIDELKQLRTKPFITDTSTLYTGRRHNAIDHTLLASEHGFCPEVLNAPFIAPDGLFGTAETAVEINCELNRSVFIASDIVRSQSIFAAAHFTGHPLVGAAAALKTLGMGCASRKGKVRQHSAMKPSVKNICTLCGECFKYCPADAVTLGGVKAHIDRDKCIGCAECLAVCRFDAIEYDWSAENELVQKNIAEHAMGVLKGKEGRAVFFNYIMSVTQGCDCFDKKDMNLLVADIGIVASTDPVAVDRASLDLVEAKAGKKIAALLKNDKLDPEIQLRYAEEIGLGSNNYEIINVD